jgi:ATP-dependent DNA helicase RecG
MNLKQIYEELNSGEGLRTEFKEAWNKLPADLFETVCSFLNTDGGIIILGVKDDGEITGIEPASVKKLKIDLANLSNNPQKIDPPYLLFPHDFEINSKTIIAVQVPLSSQLHKTGGEIFLRSEDGDYRARGTHQLAGIINRKLGLFTEQRTYPYLTINDLRAELFDKARRLMRSINSQHPWLSLSNEELLKIGGFYAFDSNSGKQSLTLAAVLMFGKDEVIQQIVPGYKFDCLLRRENLDRYDDRLIIRTNLIDAYDLMMEFVNKHLNDPFYLEGDMRISLRDKIFREAISNIISHREYTSPAPARLIIYRSKVILDNPSVRHHYGEITPENLKPFSKNPVICKFMIQLGRFDELGSGVTNINKYLPLYAKGAKPVFKETDTDFELLLPLDETAHVTIQDTIYVAAQVTAHVKRLLLVLEGEMTRAELMNKLGLRDVRHFRKGYLQPALEEKLIEMTIPNKPRSVKQKYRLSGKGKEHIKASFNIGGEITPHVTPQVELLLQSIEGQMSDEELQKRLGITDAKNFKKAYLQPALQGNLIEITIPDKPGSTKQKYRLSKKGIKYLKTSVDLGGGNTPQVTPQVKQLLQAIEGEMSRSEIQSKLGLTNVKHFRENYLQPALSLNLIEMTIPDKPNSRMQKYRLTEEGKQLSKTLEQLDDK